MVAEQALDNQALKTLTAKNWYRPRRNERRLRSTIHYDGSRALEDWAYLRDLQLDFIRPGKHMESAFIEFFNGRLRDECLNVHPFAPIAEAQNIIEA